MKTTGPSKFKKDKSMFGISQNLVFDDMLDSGQVSLKDLEEVKSEGLDLVDWSG